jgi:type III restriction enzyme
MLKLKFDAGQQHQIDAIKSIVDLFAGHPRTEAQFALSSNGMAVSNLPEFRESLDNELLEANLLAVQQANGFRDEQMARTLAMDNGPMLDAAGGDSHIHPSFTVEMETGTGKTYVYLRSIYELRRRYGYNKFVVVVPSVAIYEGVRKSFAIMRDHFRALYDNEPVDLIEYDGEQMGRVGSFARSATTTVLLITLDAFNKGGNKFYKPSEKLPGEWLPYQYVQNTRPIVILDEPQRMSSEKARQAIRALMPIASLRFSATHRESPNLCYRLTPVDAFRLNLVKKIQVVGVTERENANAPALELRNVSNAGGIRAVVRTQVTKDGQTALQDLTLARGDDLWKKTGREAHKNAGYVVDNIRAGDDGFLEFENGMVLGLKDKRGSAQRAIFRAQMRQTIKYHFDLQADLRKRGIKVLSLFFIDRVASYTDDAGIVKRLFDEEFERGLEEHASAKAFKELKPEDLRVAYFAKKKKAKSNEEEIVADETSADFKKAEQDAYKLIMQDKERLLSFDEPRCFIFAHSALREGWDNPNVFQICTLRESASDMERRQSIGRGLRLCVSQAGERVWDEEANVLTVIANESYRDFAQGLQQEYRDSGDAPPPAPKQPRVNEARRNDTIFNSGFQLFWNQLKTPLRYRIQVDTQQLINDAVTRLNKTQFSAPEITVEKGRVVIDTVSITVEWINVARNKAKLQLKLLREDLSPYGYENEFAAGEDLAKITKNKSLKPFGNFQIREEDGVPCVVFSNANVPALSEGQTFEFSPDPTAVRVRETRIVEAQQRYPVFNLIARAAGELGMTKATLNEIFRGLSSEVKQKIFYNPEGFANTFIATLRDVLADHMTERLAFERGEGLVYTDAGELFPEKEQYPQREVVNVDGRGLYDKIQVDSDVERAFIRQLLDDGRIEFYFKFPPKFRIDMPKLIGDYNPDWGIARIDETGRPVIYKIRETKGDDDVSKLRFAHEKRKVRCAKKYFAALGIDYRPIKGDAKDWWQPAPAENIWL